MLLAPGARLGPYQIVAALGAGGMGEVYRARDTRLDRSVAIKVMPPHLAADPDARQRFQREARAISSLAHPHICALHDVGNHEGLDFLVMELVDGESLLARLAHGPLPLHEALRIGAQIADALDRAHRQGIVHRDLKPANVMLARDGAKLLDFGLARTPVAPVVGSLSQDATRITPLTGEGTLLGTLHYMAPEQLEGKPADPRSDLFALGATLYEMVTGERAFDGTTPASVITAILRDRPAALSTRAPLAPFALDRLVESCLEKDPERRWQSAHDLALELRAIADAPATSAPAAQPTGRRAPTALVALAALAVGATLATAALVLLRRPASPASPGVRFEVAPPEGARFVDFVEGVSLALSPDGKRLAFIARLPGEPDRAWLRALAELTPRPLAGTEGASSLFWSPDGTQLGFVADGNLKRIALDGSPPVVLGETGEQTSVSASWGRNAILFAAVRSGRIYSLPVGGGSPTMLVEPDGEEVLNVAWPSFLPDGERFLYTGRRAEQRGELWLAEPDGTRRRIGPVGSRAEATADGYVVVQRGGALIAQRLDADRAAWIGEPRALSASLRAFASPLSATFAVSRAGTVAFASRGTEQQLTLHDASGAVLRRIGDPIAWDGNVAVDVEGRRALVDRLDPKLLTLDLWLVDLARGTEVPVTREPWSDVYGRFLPGNRQMVYASADPELPCLWVRDLDTGARRKLLPHNTFQFPVAVTRDGRTVLFIDRKPARGGLFEMPVAGGEPRLLTRPGTNVLTADVTADGTLVAYTSSESGRPEVYLRRRDGSGETLRVSVDGAWTVRFSHDGRTLFFTSLDRHQLMAAAVTTAPALAVSEPTLRFDLPRLGWADFATLPDGGFLGLTREVDQATTPITVVTGWAGPAP